MNIKTAVSKEKYDYKTVLKDLLDNPETRPIVSNWLNMMANWPVRGLHGFIDIAVIEETVVTAIAELINIDLQYIFTMFVNPANPVYYAYMDADEEMRMKKLVPKSKLIVN